MSLKDLTPQLRTRLNRLEFFVGLFVLAATLLMICGLAYYMYQRAERKGWFKQKMPYFTFVRNAEGLQVGDKVKLMGFDAGEILEIEAEPPWNYYNVYVQFQIWEPYYGYLWDDSKARVAAADFLGKRSIEATKGVGGVPTYLFHHYQELSIQDAEPLVRRGDVKIGQDIYDENGLAFRAYRPLFPEGLKEIAALGSNSVWIIDDRVESKVPTGIWNKLKSQFEPLSEHPKGYFLEPDESPALTEHLESVVNLVENNLPNILSLTNSILELLTNATRSAQRAEDLLLAMTPAATNIALITENLRRPQGALGEWLIPTNLNLHLTQTLASANLTMASASTAITNTDVRLGETVTNLNQILDNLANITGNLRSQVEANSNLVSSINQAIIQADEFMQGLKRHWLLRSAFKKKKEASTNQPTKQIRSPRDASR